MPIGVVSLQGNFAEHMQALKELDVPVKSVKSPGDLEFAKGLIIPGGESTAIGKMMKKTGLDKAIKKFKGPIWGTCAGAILLAKELESKVPVNNLKLMDIKVSRNAYGNQLDSFETEFSVDEHVFPVSFIRAPKILEVGKNCEVIIEHDKMPVLVREGNLLVSTFHSELNSGSAFYEWLMNNFFKI